MKAWDFGNGITPVVVPADCPRCSSTMLDYALDPARDPALASYFARKANELGTGCISIVLVILTLGVWLVVVGLWELVMLPVRMRQKRAAIAAAPTCVRTTCRACGLVWYPDEIYAVA